MDSFLQSFLNEKWSCVDGDLISVSASEAEGEIFWKLHFLE